MTRPADGAELRGHTQIVDPEWGARVATAYLPVDEPDRWPLGVRALVIVALAAVLWDAILLAWAVLA